MQRRSNQPHIHSQVHTFISDDVCIYCRNIKLFASEWFLCAKRISQIIRLMDVVLNTVVISIVYRSTYSLTNLSKCLVITKNANKIVSDSKKCSLYWLFTNISTIIDHWWPWILLKHLNIIKNITKQCGWKRRFIIYSAFGKNVL